MVSLVSFTLRPGPAMDDDDDDDSKTNTTETEKAELVRDPCNRTDCSLRMDKLQENVKFFPPFAQDYGSVDF